MATGGAPAPATFIFIFSVWLCLVSQLARSLPSPVSSNSSASVTNETALLSFKSALYSSGSQLDSWNSSAHFCRWPGVACGRRHPERVVALRMGSFNLSGPISPSLGNMSFFREVHLDINWLTGEIPPELYVICKYYTW